ncbi:MAG TPA: DUF4240 domain-containing protein [Galbitalea sp.]
MDTGEFFSLIESARESSEPTAPSVKGDALRDILNELSDEKVADFAGEFTKQLVRLNRWDVWGAGYVIAGGMSDDSFHYFRSWLIGKGRDAVEQALAEPDGLGLYVDTQDVENEELEYVAIELLEERGVEDDPRDAAEGSADDAPEGDPFDEETVDSLYPSLASADW